MLKLYITAIDSREDGTAVTLFEDYQLQYEDKESLGGADEISARVYEKIETIEKINNETTRPF